MSHLCGDVYRRTALFHGVQIAVEVFPIDLECAFTASGQSFAKLISRRAVQRGTETHSTVSEIFESHALREF